MVCIDNENYPKDDRYYLVEIFALKGFLGGWNAEKFGLAGLDTSTLRRWNAGREVGVEIDPDAYVPPEQVALLDPYGKLKEHMKEGVDDLLGEARVGKADLDQFQAAIEAVGNITQEEASKDIHHQYLLKVEDIGRRSVLLDVRREAIKLLEEYHVNGYFDEASYRSGTVDYLASLTSQAEQKAEKLRQLTIKEAQDLSVIREFAGDLTTQGSFKQTHFLYLNRVYEVGLSSASLTVLREALNQLIEYSENGYFDESSYESGTVDCLASLTSQADQKIEKLRAKMMLM